MPLRRLYLDRFRDRSRLGHGLAIHAEALDMELNRLRDQPPRFFESRPGRDATGEIRHISSPNGPVRLLAMRASCYTLV